MNLPVSAVRVKITAVSAGRLILMMKVLKFITRSAVQFGDRLRRYMNDENSFTLKNNRCPFLNDKNLCDIFINIGEDKLCTVCTEYPRFTETYGSLTEKGLGMSCESAAEFIFKSDKTD